MLFLLNMSIYRDVHKKFFAKLEISELVGTTICFQNTLENAKSGEAS